LYTRPAIDAQIDAHVQSPQTAEVFLAGMTTSPELVAMRSRMPIFDGLGSPRRSFREN
jgi:hypothetical protein